MLLLALIASCSSAAPPDLVADGDPDRFVFLPTGGLGPSPEVLEDAPPTCQPALFDPAADMPAGVEIVSVSGTKPLTTEPGPSGTGFEIRATEFRCASNFDYALEILRKGERHLLLTHVVAWSKAPRMERLYVEDYQAKGDQWEHQRRVIDLPSKASTTLPSHVPCTGYGAAWLDDRLLTYGEGGEHTANGRPTEVCLFGDSADPLYRFVVAADWRAPGSADVLWSRFAPLPSDPLVLVHFAPTRCVVEVQDLRDPALLRRIPLQRGPDEEPWDCAAGEAIMGALEGRSFENVGRD